MYIPLNLTLYIFRHLYKHVKLLSIGDEMPLPAMPEENLGGGDAGIGGGDPLGFGGGGAGPGGGAPGAVPGDPDANNDWDVISSTNSRLSDHTPVFPTIAFLGMAFVLVFLLNIVYKNKNKPRRKKPRLRKIAPTFGVKMPGV